MIKFRCSACKFGIEVERKNFYNQCPKCKGKMFLNYYENTQKQTKHPGRFDKIKRMKGGLNTMAEKKEKPESSREKWDKIAKDAIQFIEEKVEDKKEIRKVHSRMYRMLIGK